MRSIEKSLAAARGLARARLLQGRQKVCNDLHAFKPSCSRHAARINASARSSAGNTDMLAAA